MLYFLGKLIEIFRKNRFIYSELFKLIVTYKSCVNLRFIYLADENKIQ